MGRVGGRTTPERRYGVVLEGDLAHGVVIEGNKVVDRRTVSGASALDALNQWWSELKPKSNVRVVWSDEPIGVTMLELPPLPPDVRRVALDNAGAEQLAFGSDHVAVAGVFVDPELGTKAAVVALDGSELRPMWATPNAASIDLTVPPLLLTGAGLYLVIGFQRCEVTLVQDGYPVASRHLGGFKTLSELASEGGYESAHELIAQSRVGNVGVSQLLESWGGEVLDELRRTLEYWARQGIAITRDVTVIGAGALDTAIPNLLAQRGLEVKLAQSDFAPAEGWTSNNDGASWTLPVLAATTDLEEYAYFANPSWSAARKEKEAHARRKKQLVQVATVAGVMTMLTLAYPAYAKSKETRASSTLNAAQKRLDDERLGVRLAKSNDNVAAKVRATQSANVDWCTVTKVITGVNPDVSTTNVELTSLGTVRGGVGVKVKSQLVIPADPDPSVALQVWASYQNNLEDLLAATEVSSTGVSSAPTGSSVQIDYVLTVPVQPKAGQADERAEIWRTAESACGTGVSN
jgi:hypothetical protein